MKRNNTPVFIAFGLLVLALLFYFAFYDQKPRYNWSQSYRASSDQPYGTLYLKELLASSRQAQAKFVYNEKKPLHVIFEEATFAEAKDANYVFVGSDLYLDDQDIKALKDFISKGNNAFISSSRPPQEFLRAAFEDSCSQRLTYEASKPASSVNLNFEHEGLRQTAGYVFTLSEIDPMPVFWPGVMAPKGCAFSSLIGLGHYTEGGTNFLRMDLGAGHLYLHTNPIAFSNYFLAREHTLKYTESVFSHFTTGPMLWDEYSKLPMSGDDRLERSPLYYILQQPALKYAWWLMLATIALYVIFAARRQQRAIPVLEVKTNISLEFVRLVSALHFRNGNPLNMARKKMRYFLFVIRTRYGIQAQPFKEEHIAMLADKSKVNIEEVRTIFTQYGSIESNAYYNTQAGKLLDLFNAIENFNRKCK